MLIHYMQQLKNLRRTFCRHSLECDEILNVFLNFKEFEVFRQTQLFRMARDLKL